MTAPSEGSWVDDVDVTSSCRAQSRFAFLGAEAGDVKDLMQATLSEHGMVDSALSLTI